jgi:hypothetical protein
VRNILNQFQNINILNRKLATKIKRVFPILKRKDPKQEMIHFRPRATEDNQRTHDENESNPEKLRVTVPIKYQQRTIKEKQTKSNSTIYKIDAKISLKLGR